MAPSSRVDLSYDDSIVAAIARGVESDVGEAFFNALVTSVAQVLGVQYAFVSELTRGGTHFRTLGFWARGQIARDFEVALAGTPCQAVLEGQAIFHPDRLQERFPEDRVLVDWSAQSYAGVPLVDSQGEVIGHLAFVHDRPWGEGGAGELALSVMRIFAKRTAAEIERRRLDEQRAEAEQRIAGIVDSAADAIISFDESGRVQLFNRAAERVLRCAAADALGQPIAKFTAGDGALALGAAQRAVAADPQLRLYVGEGEGLRARRSDGTTFPFESSLSYSGVPGHALYTLILRNLDERREEERELARLRRHNEQLQEELAERHASADDVVGLSTSLEKVFEQLELVAPTDSTVLIRGETGVGKELVARALHARSRRSERPLVKVNCAAIPAGLVESELFGHEKGAFTGATTRRIGRFELAHTGTIFLDEIGELPLDAQVKLLRILQEREFERVGGATTLHADVRILAATNRNLEQAVEEGSFREDLYYRLNVFPLLLPPLRERLEDIPLLAAFFLTRHAPRIGRQANRLSEAALERLAAYSWPGNVRELENVIERALILSGGQARELGVETIERVLGAGGASARGAGAEVDAAARRSGEAGAPGSLAPRGTLEEMQRLHVEEALRAAGGRIEGRGGAAEALGLAPSTLRSLMKRRGVVRPPIASR